MSSFSYNGYVPPCAPNISMFPNGNKNNPQPGANFPSQTPSTPSRYQGNTSFQHQAPVFPQHQTPAFSQHQAQVNAQPRFGYQPTTQAPGQYVGATATASPLPPSYKQSQFQNSPPVLQKGPVPTTKQTPVLPQHQAPVFPHRRFRQRPTAQAPPAPPLPPCYTPSQFQELPPDILQWGQTPTANHLGPIPAAPAASTQQQVPASPQQRPYVVDLSVAPNTSCYPSLPGFGSSFFPPQQTALPTAPEAPTTTAALPVTTANTYGQPSFAAFRNHKSELPKDVNVNRQSVESPHPDASIASILNPNPPPDPPGLGKNFKISTIFHPNPAPTLPIHDPRRRQYFPPAPKQTVNAADLPDFFPDFSKKQKSAYFTQKSEPNLPTSLPNLMGEKLLHTHPTQSSSQNIYQYFPNGLPKYPTLPNYGLKPALRYTPPRTEEQEAAVNKLRAYNRELMGERPKKRPKVHIFPRHNPYGKSDKMFPDAPRNKRYQQDMDLTDPTPINDLEDRTVFILGFDPRKHIEACKEKLMEYGKVVDSQRYGPDRDIKDPVNGAYFTFSLKSEADYVRTIKEFKIKVQLPQKDGNVFGPPRVGQLLCAPVNLTGFLKPKRKGCWERDPWTSPTKTYTKMQARKLKYLRVKEDKRKARWYKIMHPFENWENPLPKLRRAIGEWCIPPPPPTPKKPVFVGMGARRESPYVPRTFRPQPTLAQQPYSLRTHLKESISTVGSRALRLFMPY